MTEQVEVVTGAGADGSAPIAFTWRGRSYAVREVLGQWRERRPWWRTVLEPESALLGAAVESSGAVTHDLVAPRELEVTRELEERVWRVAASPGRSLGWGVYELGHGRGWRLLGIED